jgi:transposase
LGKPYSSDLRGRFVRLLEEGLSASAAGRRLLVARSTATRWSKIWHGERRSTALPMGGDQRSHVIEAHGPIILALVEETPDIFLHEIVAKLAARNIAASPDMVSGFLARHGITRKKRHSSPPNKAERILPKRVCNGATG